MRINASAYFIRISYSSLQAGGSRVKVSWRASFLT
jgi:hypothetical protein